MDDDYEFSNDDTVAKNQRHAVFFHDSTHTLCSEDRFSAYRDEDDEENEQMTGNGMRSNSLSILQLDDQSTFVEKLPKKAVRFADMMVCDSNRVGAKN